MKKIIIFILVACTFICCQKKDDNGDLGGFWKLIEIEETGSDTPTDVAMESRFWGIQLDLLEIRITNNDRHYFRFQHVSDSLFIQTITDKADLRAYGIYENHNERYKVVRLNRKSMILRSKYAKLTFRKF